jgi:hypothetical protein
MFRAFIRAAGLLLFGALLFASPAGADTRIYLGTAPPRPIVEVHRGEHPGYAWHDGYYRWSGHRYVWVRGRWVRPPYRHAQWTSGGWHRERRGWYWVPGHWAR